MMRCTSCNVDLEELQQSCPLFEKPASHEKAHVTRNSNPYPTENLRHKRVGPTVIYLIKVK